MSTSQSTELKELARRIRRLHDRMRDAIVASAERTAVDEMAEIAHDETGDTIYAIDRIGEARLIDAFETEIAPLAPVVLIAEGLPDGGKVVLPRGTPAAEAVWRVIVDPIDGTRGLMYQKRSAWILTGVAPNRGPETSLSDIIFAVQTEVPLIKQHLTDQVWAFRGTGVRAERLNRLTGDRTPLTLRPSQATTIAHSFATVARFFPGSREVLAAIDDAMVAKVLGPVQPGKAQTFEDQYISTGGQLYELMAGHDRFVADLRPLTEAMLAREGLALGLACHPYDICTALIAEGLGVVITGAEGDELDAPLAVEPDVAWIGYANPAIRAQVEPALQAAIHDALGA